MSKDFNKNLVLKWFFLLAAICAGFFPLMEAWLGFSWTLPLNARFRPSANPVYVFLCILIFLTVTFLWKKNLLVSLSELKFLIFSLFTAFAFHTCLASTDKGFYHAITHPFISTPYEYYADLPVVRLNGLKNFVANYPALMKTLSLHAHTHPPGGDVFLYLVEKIFGRGLLRASLITVIVSNFSLIPFYYTIKLFIKEKASRLAVIIWIFTPAIAIYSAVCMDGVFMFFMLWPIYFILRSYVKGKNIIPLAILSGISLSSAALMTFSTSYEILFFIILTGFCIFKKPEKVKGMTISLFVAGAIVLFSHILLYFIAGYDVLACLEEARDKDLTNFRPAFYSIRDYFYSRTSNFIGFLSFMGFASSGMFCFYLSKKMRRLKCGNLELRSVIYAAILTMLELNLGGLYNYETGRIWIYLTPLFLAPVAETLEFVSESSGINRFDTQLLTFTFLQTLIAEILLFTFW